MKKIDLSTKTYPNVYAFVDDADFELLNQWKWSTNSIGYAVRFKYIGRINGKPKYKPVYMHRVINNTPIGLETDHIDRNKLNNQRHNLRSVNKSQNGRNKNINPRNTSGFTGVYWFKRLKKWRARILIDRKEISLGYFLNIKDAVIAREKMIVKLNL